jgi:hypothetical protein
MSMMHGANMNIKRRRVNVILTRHISHLHLNHNVRELLLTLLFFPGVDLNGVV